MASLATVKTNSEPLNAAITVDDSLTLARVGAAATARCMPVIDVERRHRDAVVQGARQVQRQRDQVVDDAQPGRGERPERDERQALLRRPAVDGQRRRLDQEDGVERRRRDDRGGGRPEQVALVPDGGRRGVLGDAVEGVDVAADAESHTSAPAMPPETPSAVVASRAAAVFSISQRDAMTNAIIATAP